jgi:Leucine Rich repeat
VLSACNERLDKDACRIENSAVATLERLTGLASLNLAYSNLTDPGVKALCGELTGLTYLSLDSRLVTDAGLLHLTKLTNLEALDIFGCKACTSLDMG